MPSAARNLANLLGGSATIPQEKLGSDISTIEQVATTAQLSDTGNSVGDQRVVGNNLYIWNGSGWYRIALINETPTWDSGGQPLSEYNLDGDSPQTATTITLAATDPDGFPISYTYVTGGSMDSIATISQDSSVFTITPKTEVQAPDGGTGTITFRASDGVNILPYVSSFTLNFISTIENSRHTTLLATATGTSDNNNITDTSTNNHSITVNGDAHAGTFSPYRSGGYSTYFDGTSGLRAPTATGTTLQGTTTFTVEFWYNTKTVATGNKVIWGSRSNTSNTDGDDTIGRMFQNGGTLYYSVNGSFAITASSVISANTWYYIALVVDSGAASLYLDGARIATGNYTSANGSDRISVGHTANTPQQYIADFRINTAAEYSGTSHTVPTEPLLNTSNTVFHLPTKGYLATDLTLTGTPSTKPFSPYDNLEYSAADHGGSVYFDGTGDYVEMPGHSSLVLDTSNFTLEFWYKHVANVTTMRFLGNNYQNSTWGGGRWTMGIISGKLIFQANSLHGGGNYTSSTVSIDDGAWHHCSLTRDGSTFTLRVDGNDPVTYANSGSLDGGNSYGFTVGGRGNGTEMINGYISDFKLVKGTVLYTADFTPPTAPLSSSGTSLHIKGTDASIIDKSQGANLKLVGNTTGSTTQAKFADTKSMYFDGIDDHIVGPNISDLNIGTGDFTAECWVYETSLNTNRGIWDGRSTGSTTDGFTFTRINTDAFRIWSGSALITTDPVTIQNTWVHCAVVRYNGTLTIYINGSSSGTPVSNSTNFSNSGTFIIGAGRHSTTATPTAFIAGYIQDLRVSNYARYTASFTPPTASLEG